MSDLISRAETLSILSNLNSAWVGYEKVSRLPTIDAVPVVHGEWKRSHSNWGECSACGEHNKYLKRWNYCPNCGARMDGGEDDG